MYKKNDYAKENLIYKRAFYFNIRPSNYKSLFPKLIDKKKPLVYYKLSHGACYSKKTGKLSCYYVHSDGFGIRYFDNLGTMQDYFNKEVIKYDKTGQLCTRFNPASQDKFKFN